MSETAETVAAPTETAAPVAAETVVATPAVAEAAPKEAAVTDSPTSLLDKPAEEAKAPEAEKPAEEPKAIDPASYEVKLPEGITREDPLVAAFLEGAAGAKLDGAAVQAVLDKTAPLVAEAMQAPYKAWNDLNTAWKDQFRADPELGGANFDNTLGVINGALDRFGTPELKEALRLTGAANNPHILRYLHALSLPYAEGRPVGASPGATSGDPGQRALASMYPSAAKPQ